VIGAPAKVSFLAALICIGLGPLAPRDEQPARAANAKGNTFSGHPALDARLPLSKLTIITPPEGFSQGL
jgi:hypothetical protein